ncbi:ribosome maturation factor RimM [Pseudomarimonas arenosa]|uniref:Ribosome maturation factor RimM n=1 Tax=Pseudomarimonas arenosa TaxID=2774145 RepID=A0AAW3ZJC0_9GAMM|nr:ribosome maturation factor RimM [Pseudomarimonas arenosa]MBD8526188.1 16S rRNA processing protein RimM [Pseudomarimonas arenosa]
MTDRRVLVAEVVGAFGVRGELKLRTHTETPMAVARYRPWYLIHRGVVQIVEKPSCRETEKGVLARLADIESRDQAEALVGAEIWVDRGALPELPAGEFYWVDLEGLQVETVAGQPLGKVSHLLSTGANDVVVVQGERERLIPYLRPDVITDIDLSAGRMVVDWDPDF